MKTDCDDNPSEPSGRSSLRKTPTGIQGLDEITHGGIPSGRPTLVCGGAGCGKSLLAMEFLVRGASLFGETGVFVSFEERPQDILTNFGSVRFGLGPLVEKGTLQLLHFSVEAKDLTEAGSFDLEGLFVRLDLALRRTGAKRLVLDTIETLFGGIRNHAILRAELHRLFSWLKDRDVTCVITGERGDNQLTRQGLEEYVSDCVILMDHRVSDQISTRRLRIVKYRGSLHGTNEYPFLIDDCGVSLFPVTTMGLTHDAPTERVSSGVAKLDEMLGGAGYYRGSTVLVSGMAGSGKTSLAAHFARAAFERGERTLYFAFEESPKQLARNMRSIGIDLEPAMASGLLRIEAARATFYGLELHLLKIHRLVREFKPANVIIDPFTNFASVGTTLEVQLMLTRLVDFLKSAAITTLLTSLTSAGSPVESSEAGVSAWIDTWLLLKEIESSGERNRGLYVLKSRGMPHSNQIREFVITSHGIDLVPVYLGPAGMLTGSARVAQEGKERTIELARRMAHDRELLELEQKERALRAKVVASQAELESIARLRSQVADQFSEVGSRSESERSEMASSRMVPASDPGEAA